MKLSSKSLDEALANVKSIIEKVVRDEQLRDQLTELPNDMALDEDLNERIEKGEPFWVGFVEIDQFKRINDEYGYQNADLVLKKVAEHMARASEDFFVDVSKSYRAHGDEFYIVGSLAKDTETDIETQLEKIRSGIEGIRIAVADKDSPMVCSVSVGWATSEDATDQELTLRGMKLALESAVSFAKRKGRNRVVRYSDETRKQTVWSIRDTCAVCQSAFTVDVPEEDTRETEIFCPDCGNKTGRPQKPGSPPTVRELVE